MTLCAGLCYYSRMTKSCHIKLSQPILQYRPIEDVVDTLLASQYMPMALIWYTLSDASRVFVACVC